MSVRLRALARLAALAVVLLGLGGLADEWLGRRVIPGHADVAVVFGAGFRRDGTPLPQVGARLACALEVWREHRADRMIVSSTLRYGVNEPRAMRTWLVAHGVPDSAVTEDPHGDNTWATARFTRDWLAARGGHSAIAVSQYYHLPRCRLALARHGVGPVRTAGPDYVDALDLVSAPREVLGLVEYAVRPGPRPATPAGGLR